MLQRPLARGHCLQFFLWNAWEERRETATQETKDGPGLSHCFPIRCPHRAPRSEVCFWNEVLHSLLKFLDFPTPILPNKVGGATLGFRSLSQNTVEVTSTDVSELVPAVHLLHFTHPFQGTASTLQANGIDMEGHARST